MIKPKRLVGFINYNEIEYPFELDNEAFSIKLYPPTRSVWGKDSSPMQLLRSFERDTTKHEWVLEKYLKGITSERYRIIFNVKDNPSTYNGFTSFMINWYVYHTDELSLDRVDGFQISGHDVNYFYPPLTALKPEIEFNEDGRSLKRMAVTTNEQITKSCGKYRVSEKIDANIDVTAYASIHYNTWENPIDSTSYMLTTFSVPVDLKILIIALGNLLRFFEYVTYRHNVNIGNIDLFYRNKDGLNHLEGTLVIHREYENETHERAKNRIIPYKVLTERSAELFTAIKDKLLGFEHLCNSIKDTGHYQASRIIMIFAAFEREYKNIYGIDNGRSEEYLQVKNDVISLINDYHEAKHGKEREYAKQLSDYVKRIDNSFKIKVKSALLDCESIMSPFVGSRYKGSYTDVIEQISSRMGEVRNGIAHSHLDLQFDAIHLSDIKIIEELLYATRLKKASISNEDCQKAIKSLFAE